MCLNAYSYVSLKVTLTHYTLICTVTNCCNTQTSSCSLTIHVSGTVTQPEAPTSEVPVWTGSGTVCTHVAWLTLYKGFFFISNCNTWLVLPTKGNYMHNPNWLNMCLLKNLLIDVTYITWCNMDKSLAFAIFTKHLLNLLHL